MATLAFHLFDAPEMGALGLWIFLSIGTVALFVVFIPVTSWIDSQRKEREAFYKAETLRRIAESTTEGGKAAVELLREQDRLARVKSREGMKAGGLINIGVGIALIFFLRGLTGPAIALCGLFPGLIGVGMLVYVYVLAAPLDSKP
jgi:hypothetical protein